MYDFPHIAQYPPLEFALEKQARQSSHYYLGLIRLLIGKHFNLSEISLIYIGHLYTFTEHVAYLHSQLQMDGNETQNLQMFDNIFA